MGSWDVSPFGNDEARDWLAELILGTSTDPVFRALVEAARVRPDEFFETPECERAIAAAEIVAAARGVPAEDVPAELTRWLAEHKLVAGDQIAQVAVRVLDRIASDSELKQVWDDTDSAQEWYSSLRDIQARLKQQPQDHKLDALPEAPPTVESLVEQAAALVAEQRYAEALQKYDLAASLDSSAQLIYMGRGICHLWMGKYEKVVEDINKALSVGQPIPDAYQLRSQAFFHLKKYRNVVADLTSYLRVRPKNMEGYLIRGLAYLNLQQPQNAIADFTFLIDNHSLEHLVEAFNNRAICYEQLGRPDLGAWDRQHAMQFAHAAMYRVQ